MAYTKPKIYTLSLSALLLAKEVTEVETDKSNEVRILNIHWDIALESTLKDLDLDSLSTPITLELITTTDEGSFRYIYKYPSNCALLRRIQTQFRVDNRSTMISKRVGIHNGQKVIFCNEDQAVAECIPNNLPLSALSAMAGMALVYKLALLSAPLITGKGAQKLIESLERKYIIAKAEAQEDDARENASYEGDEVRSEFVAARLE